MLTHMANNCNRTGHLFQGVIQFLMDEYNYSRSGVSTMWQRNKAMAMKVYKKKPSPTIAAPDSSIPPTMAPPTSSIPQVTTSADQPAYTMAKLTNAERMRIYRQNMDPTYKAILLKRKAEYQRKKRAAAKAAAAKVAVDPKTAADAEAAKIPSVEADAALKVTAVTPRHERAVRIARSDPLAAVAVVPEVGIVINSPPKSQDATRAVCKGHGAYHNPHDESTVFDQSCQSAFDDTTVTLPNQRATAVSRGQDSSGNPPSVIICQVTDYEEVSEES